MSPAPVGACSRRVTRDVVALTIVGMAVDSVFWATTQHRVLYGHLGSIALSAVLLAVLLAVRERCPDWLCAGALLVNIAVAVAAFWVSDRALAYSGQRWTPFEPQRLGALALAFLAPTPPWLGITAIAAMALAPVVEWLTWPAWVHARLPVEVPWVFGAYVFFAFFLYVQRLAAQATARRAARAEAEAAAAERVARVFLAWRDQCNTPLQTMELTVALARKRRSVDAAILGRLERAAGRLVEIGRALETSGLEPKGFSGAARRRPSPARRSAPGRSSRRTRRS
jgi:hypothetical protein